MANIHPTAIVDSRAELDDDVVVGPYCVLGADVRIGSGTVLHNHVTVQRLTTIGRDNVFYPHSVIGADPQDRKFHGEHCECLIGDRNQIREHVTIHRGTGNGGGYTIVGNDNLIMVSAHVAHDCSIGNCVVIANQVMIAGHVVIRDYANIGGGTGVHHFATIGESSFVGGMARIAKDVPPYMIVEGSPAEVRALNSIALSRRGFSAAHIEAMKEAYKRLYRENGQAMTDTIDKLRVEFANVPAVMTLCDALDATAEGVHGRALELKRTDDKRAAVPEIVTRSVTYTT